MPTLPTRPDTGRVAQTEVRSAVVETLQQIIGECHAILDGIDANLRHPGADMGGGKGRGGRPPRGGRRSEDDDESDYPLPEWHEDINAQWHDDDWGWS